MRYLQWILVLGLPAAFIIGCNQETTTEPSPVAQIDVFPDAPGTWWVYAVQETVYEGNDLGYTFDDTVRVEVVGTLDHPVLGPSRHWVFTFPDTACDLYVHTDSSGVRFAEFTSPDTLPDPWPAVLPLEIPLELPLAPGRTWEITTRDFFQHSVTVGSWAAVVTPEGRFDLALPVHDAVFVPNSPTTYDVWFVKDVGAVRMEFYNLFTLGPEIAQCRWALVDHGGGS
jgi:hypothetical protein